MKSLSKALLASALVFAAPSLAAAQQCPSYETSGAPLSYSSEQVWESQSHTVVAGGGLDLALCESIPGVGHIMDSPDFTLQFDSLDMGRALEFRVEADCDTVLLVSTAHDAWEFNDDDTDSNPRVRVEDAPDGQYDIWVGAYDAETCEATLMIESF